MKDTYKELDDKALVTRCEQILGKMVKQHVAPVGYEVNVGHTFRVGDYRIDGDRAWVAQIHGAWIPLEHVRQVGTVKFAGEEGTTLALCAVGRGKTFRLCLAEPNMTTSQLEAVFRAAADYLAVDETVDVSVGIDY